MIQYLMMLLIIIIIIISIKLFFINIIFYYVIKFNSKLDVLNNLMMNSYKLNYSLFIYYSILLYMCVCL